MELSGEGCVGGLAGPSRQLPFSRCPLLGGGGAECGLEENWDGASWAEDELRALPLEAFDERYRRYRLPDAAAEAAMAGSLGRYGQLSPLAVCLREERPEVLDGFKRVAAARSFLESRPA